MTQTANFTTENSPSLSKNADTAENSSNYSWALGVIRRNIVLISAGCAAGLGYGAYTIQGISPTYTATAIMLFNNQRVNALREMYNVDAASAIDTSAFDSQTEILRSEKIARTVIGRLNLLTEWPVVAEQKGLLESLLSALRGAGESTANAATQSEDVAPAARNALENGRLRGVVGKLRDGLGIRRIRQSWAVEFSFTAQDPELAARVANAYTDAYLAEQLDAKYEAARQAGGWLEDQITELKQKAINTERSIQKFKVANNLQSTGDVLVDESRYADVNRQLIEVHAEVTRLTARYNHIKSIIDNHRTESVVSEVMGNAVIESLRSKYLDASKRESEIARTYGKDHEQAIKLRKEMQECLSFMFEELVRITDSYRNELEIASARQRSLNEIAGNLTGKTAQDNATLAELRDLERKADTYRTLHRSALQRYEEVLQQQSFPVGNARLISAATPPSSPNQSGKLRTMLASIAFGGLIGGGLGAVWELADRSYRTSDQIRKDLELEFFGPLYRVSTGSPSQPLAMIKKLFPAISLRQTRKLRGRSLTEDVLSHAVRNPLSSFADTLNAVRICADQKLSKNKTKLIGVVSMLPGEGRSVVAHNLAALLADAGIRVLLIDGNLRNPSLTRSLAAEAERGLVETVSEGASLDETVICQIDTRLAFLPAIRPERVSHTADFLSSDGMKALLEKAEDSYDYVILDLPPTSAVVDSRAIAPLLNGLVLIVEWGSTPSNVVRRALETESQIRAKCLGVIFNKVDLQALKLYEQSSSREYYLDQCSHYHQKPTTA